MRVQVLTNAGALDRDKQIALVERLTALVSGAPGNPPPPARIWVLLTEAAPDGGWGLWGSAHTNDELIAAARSQMAAAADRRRTTERLLAHSDSHTGSASLAVESPGGCSTTVNLKNIMCR